MTGALVTRAGGSEGGGKLPPAKVDPGSDTVRCGADDIGGTGPFCCPNGCSEPEAADGDGGGCCVLTVAAVVVDVAVDCVLMEEDLCGDEDGAMDKPAKRSPPTIFPDMVASASSSRTFERSSTRTEHRYDVLSAPWDG